MPTSYLAFRTGDGAVNAPAIAAALGARAEAVCRHLPAPRQEARAATGSRATWTAPAAVRSTSASPVPARPESSPMRPRASTATCSTSSATATGAPTLRAALDEARAFLALPAAPAIRATATAYDAAEAARRLWRRCRAIDGTHAESLSPRPRSRALPLRGAALPRRASLPRRPDRAPPAGAGRRRNRRRRRRPAASNAHGSTLAYGPPKTMLHTAPPLYGRGHTRGSAVVAFAPAVWSAGVRESQIGNGPARYRRVHAEARTCAIC